MNEEATEAEVQLVTLVVKVLELVRKFEQMADINHVESMLPSGELSSRDHVITSGVFSFAASRLVDVIPEELR